MERVETILAEGYIALFSEEEVESLRMEAELPKEMEAPVEKGDKLGRAVLFLGDEKIKEMDLLAKEAAPTFTLTERLQRLAANWLSWRKF